MIIMFYFLKLFKNLIFNSILFLYFFLKNIKYLSKNKIDKKNFLLICNNFINFKSKKNFLIEPGHASWHLNLFLEDDNFIKCYKLASDRNSWNTDNKFRTYIACWAANQVKDLKGDFVECGVNKGGMVAAIIEYINFKNLDKKFYLFDTFSGIPENKILVTERLTGINKKNYKDVYINTIEYFSKYKNIKLIKGELPESLDLQQIDLINFLSIDLNVPNVEIAVLEKLWDKIVVGGVVLLDDYSYSYKYAETYKHFKAFAKKENFEILELPTGQGMLIKK